MPTALLVVVSVLYASSSVLAEEWVASRESYQKWSKVYNRAEGDSRFITWMKALEKVRQINSVDLGWTAGMTKFADMSPEEFRSTVLLRNPIDVSSLDRSKKLLDTGSEEMAVKESTLSFDWKDIGAVTPVKDQGFVGTCWSFSTVANVEGQYFLATNQSLNLSEEYLVDCDGTSDYDSKHADCSVFGGWPYLAYQFIMKQGGIPSSVDVPYCAGTGDCYPCMKGPENLCGPPPYYCDRERDLSVCANPDMAANIKDWGYIDPDEEAMTSTLQRVGPLSALLDATQLQYYKGGVWTGAAKPATDGNLLSCSKNYLDHAVLITGFGVDENTGQKFFNLKNSWGADFGEEGYVRILRGSGECGINTAVTSSVM